jgi:hypothetical protein
MPHPSPAYLICTTRPNTLDRAIMTSGLTATGLIVLTHTQPAIPNLPDHDWPLPNRSAIPNLPNHTMHIITHPTGPADLDTLTWPMLGHHTCLRLANACHNLRAGAHSAGPHLPRLAHLTLRDHNLPLHTCQTIPLRGNPAQPASHTAAHDAPYQCVTFPTCHTATVLTEPCSPSTATPAKPRAAPLQTLPCRAAPVKEVPKHR